jgi:hypothetical protein
MLVDPDLIKVAETDKKKKINKLPSRTHLVFYVSKPLNWPPQYNMEAVRYRVAVHGAHTA